MIAVDPVCVKTVSRWQSRIFDHPVEKKYCGLRSRDTTANGVVENFKSIQMSFAGRSSFNIYRDCPLTI